MATEEFPSLSPLLVGVVPGQHPEVLATAASLAAGLGAPLACAYVDEASYVVEWDPARPSHRLSQHPDAPDADIAALTAQLKETIAAAVAGAAAAVTGSGAGTASGAGAPAWTLHTLTGDAARALGRLASELDAPMIIVGTSERGFAHRISEALNGSVGAWLSHHQGRPVLVVPARRAGEPAPGERHGK